MGGERGSTARQRLSGKICALCSRPIDPGNWPGGERRCDRCAGIRRIYLTFSSNGSRWACSFVESDLKTPIGPTRRFATADKVRELIARTPTRLDLACKQAIEHALAEGRGGLFLQLTEDQYRKLKGI